MDGGPCALKHALGAQPVLHQEGRVEAEERQAKVDLAEGTSRPCYLAHGIWPLPGPIPPLPSPYVACDRARRLEGLTSGETSGSG